MSQKFIQDIDLVDPNVPSQKRRWYNSVNPLRSWIVDVDDSRSFLLQLGTVNRDRLVVPLPRPSILCVCHQELIPEVLAISRSEWFKLYHLDLSAAITGLYDDEHDFQVDVLLDCRHPSASSVPRCFQDHEFDLVNDSSLLKHFADQIFIEVVRSDVGLIQ